MKKNWILLTIILSIVLGILLYDFFEYKGAHEYEDSAIPFYAQDLSTHKPIYAKTPKEFAQKMLNGEEYFKGSLHLTARDHDTAEIKLTNTITGDDSMIAIEYYAVAVRTPLGWKLTEYKAHWKCRGLFTWPDFWTTSRCG